MERQDDSVWIRHSGGLPGYTTTVCFDPGTQVGAIVPGQVFLMMPYLLSIAALCVIARRADYPKALMIPYIKGQR